MDKIKFIFTLAKSLLKKSDGQKTITGVAIALLSSVAGSQAATLLGLVTASIGLLHKVYKLGKEAIKLVKEEQAKKK